MKGEPWYIWAFLIAWIAAGFTVALFAFGWK